MLTGFQNDLGAISDDMKLLQGQSVCIHQVWQILFVRIVNSGTGKQAVSAE